MQYTHRPATLWTELRAGNRDALGELYKDYSPELHKYGFQVCRDPDMVSDCIHELFSRLWTQHERIADAQNVRIYLYKSLERILVAQLLRKKKQVKTLTESENKADSFEQLWIDKEEHKERLNEVKRCLQSLPKCQREVILLKFFNDLSYSEISEIMEMQVASVYNLTSKAIEHLRQKMHLEAVSA
ncbi:MAG TPA: sigma-70 family RNA polymerase sigma factor [Cyclobacteriaceae bacterium]|nr:sigma-70 family RNA polymerase sigma factor [Cyclobacteriaceae bacterium]